jgi:hypothetical protein
MVYQCVLLIPFIDRKNMSISLVILRSVSSVGLVAHKERWNGSTYDTV